MSARGKDIVRGAAAGALGTAAMTVVMLAARALGSRAEEPPRRITRFALEAARAPALIRRGALLDAASVVAHFGYGATMGVLFRIGRSSRSGRRRLRWPGAKRPLASSLAHGAIFGAALYAASYAGWVPVAGILPPPAKDRPDRQAELIAAHLVYGVTVAVAS